MPMYEYKLLDDAGTIEADKWDIETSVTKNLENEISVVKEYVFYKDEKEVLRIPVWFLVDLREVG